MMKPCRALALALSFGSVAAVLAAATPEGPPAAPVRPVTDYYFGQKIADPYRYMEVLNDPAVQGWLKAQADYTSSVLSVIPGREKLRARLHELIAAATARVGDVTVLPGLVLFYEKTLSTENVAKLYTRRGLTGEEKLLLDPMRLDKPGGAPHVINYYAPSFDGRHVAVGISEGGSEQAIIHIVETASGRESPETIDRAPWGGVAWKDERSFFYNRMQEMRPGMPPAEKELKSTAWLHTIGAAVGNDTPVFGYDRSRRVAFDPIDIPIIATSPDSSFAAGAIAHGVRNEMTLYAAELASMGPAGTIPWKKVVDADDQITDMATHGVMSTSSPIAMLPARRF